MKTQSKELDLRIEENDTDNGAKLTLMSSWKQKLAGKRPVWKYEELFTIGVSESEYKALHTLANKTGKDICDVAAHLINKELNYHLNVRPLIRF
jgi:hypothetical protein